MTHQRSLVVGIFLSEEDYRASRTKNGLWLSFPKDGMWPMDFDRRPCLVEGVFDPENTGHMGLWSGAISVQKIQHALVRDNSGAATDRFPVGSKR